MPKTHHLAAIIIAMATLSSAAAVEYNINTSHGHMHGHQHRANNVQREHIQNIRRRVIEKAKYVPPNEQRLLYTDDNYNTDDIYSNGNGIAAGAGSNDDDYTTDTSWYTSVGFDPTKYSLAYHSCKDVKQFDDTIAKEEYSTSPFGTKHYAMFRLCPSDYCGDNGSSDYDDESSLFDRLGANGANGKGCKSDYGEYMLELRDYLGIMADYHNQRFEKYCDTCQECIYDVYSDWMSNWMSSRKLKDIDDQSFHDDLDSDEFQSHRDLGYSPYTACAEYASCEQYKSTCNSGLNNYLTQYFTCSQVQGNSALYIGPYCDGDDGVSISLGVFKDQYCSEYVGDSIPIESLLGSYFDNDSLFEPYLTGSLVDFMDETSVEAHKEIISSGNFSYSSELAEYYNPLDQICIPCKASRQPYEVLGSVYDDDATTNDINDLCETLYMTSARCDKHISYDESTEQIEAVATLQGMSCDFIESVLKGKVDNDGLVDIGRKNWRKYRPGIVWSKYAKETAKMSPLQALGLSVSIVGCLVLGMWAYILQFYIIHKRPLRLIDLRASVARAKRRLITMDFDLPEPIKSRISSRKGNGMTSGKGNNDQSRVDDSTQSIEMEYSLHLNTINYDIGANDRRPKEAGFNKSRTNPATDPILARLDGFIIEANPMDDEISELRDGPSRNRTWHKPPLPARKTIANPVKLRSTRSITGMFTRSRTTPSPPAKKDPILAGNFIIEAKTDDDVSELKCGPSQTMRYLPKPPLSTIEAKTKDDEVSELKGGPSQIMRYTPPLPTIQDEDNDQVEIISLPLEARPEDISVRSPPTRVERYIDDEVTEPSTLTPIQPPRFDRFGQVEVAITVENGIVDDPDESRADVENLWEEFDNMKNLSYATSNMLERADAIIRNLDKPAQPIKRATALDDICELDEVTHASSVMNKKTILMKSIRKDIDEIKDSIASEMSESATSAPSSADPSSASPKIIPQMITNKAVEVEKERLPQANSWCEVHSETDSTESHKKVRGKMKKMFGRRRK